MFMMPWHGVPLHRYQKPPSGLEVKQSTSPISPEVNGCTEKMILHFPMNIEQRHSFIIFLCWIAATPVFAQDDFFLKLSVEAIELTKQKVIYDPGYFKIPYPNGDVPPGKGVCTDVIIRTYRKLGVDLQKEVHEDMKNNFALYPKNWGLKTTDRNIDHRR